MRPIAFSFLLLAVSITTLCAQTPMPLIRAASTHIRILDGDDLREGAIVPALRPDVYVCHKSAAPRRVVYYTDQDSIAFTVRPGDNHNFVVLLNGKDSCYQRFTTLNPERVVYTGRPGAAADTIPFVLGPNNAVHIRGCLNNSDTLDLIFDTGASLGVLSDEGQEKGARCYEGNRNVFSLAGVRIAGSPVKYIDYHGAAKSDGILGFNAFEDKVVEVDYDRKILIVRNSGFAVPAGYTALPMQWRGTAMFVETTLRFGQRSHRGLFLFDLGSRWALSVTRQFAGSQKLYDAAPVVGRSTGTGVSGVPIRSRTILVPELLLGDLVLRQVPAELENPGDTPGLDFNIMGNDILKRFNVILDYKQGMIYLRPNSLADVPYFRPVSTTLLTVCGATLLIISALGWWLLRKYRRSRRQSNTSRS